jgi:phage gpG-like protein
MITVQIDESAVRQLQQRMAAFPARLTARVYKALGPLIYQALSAAVPRYFAGSGAPGGDMLTSRSGTLLKSVLQSIQANVDGEKLSVSIGSDLPYAAIHEYGGIAGRRGPFKKKDGHRPYLRPRPYLQPAMKDLEHLLPGLLEQAIQQAQASNDISS